MDGKESLFRGIINYSISTWINIVVGFFSVLITTRLLMPDVYGQVTMFYTVTNVMMYIITLGMDGAMIRFYNEPPNIDTRNQLVYKNIVVSSIVCFVLAGIVVSFLGHFFSHRVFGITSRLLTGMVFVFTFCQIILRYLNISFRMSFQTTKYNIQNILITSITRVLVIIAAVFTTGFIYLISILTIGILLILLIYIFIQRNEILPISENGVVNFNISLKAYGPYFRFAFYNAPTYIITYLNLYLSQQIIIGKINAFALGIFASTSAFTQILSAFKGGFSTYWSAFVYKNYKNAHGKIKQMHDYVLILSIIFSSLLVLSRDIIYLVIGTNFHESKTFFSLLLIMPVLCFILETTDKGIALRNKNEILLLTHVISVLINLIVAFFLIDYYGLKGVAFANAFSGVVLYSLNTFCGQKYYRTIISNYKSIFGVGVILYILTIPLFVYEVIYLLLFILPVDFLACFIFRSQLIYIKDNVVFNLFKN